MRAFVFYLLLSTVLYAAPGRELFFTRMGEIRISFVRGNLVEEDSGAILLEIGTNGSTGRVGQAIEKKRGVQLKFLTSDPLPYGTIYPVPLVQGERRYFGLVINGVTWTLHFSTSEALDRSTYPLPAAVRAQCRDWLSRLRNPNLDGLDFDLRCEVSARNQELLKKTTKLLRPFQVSLAFKTVFESTFLALHQADTMGEHEISIPLLGINYPGALSSGEFLTETQSTAAILSALKRFSTLNPHPRIKTVRIVAFDRDASSDAWLRGSLYRLFAKGTFADIGRNLAPTAISDSTWSFLKNDFLLNDSKHTKTSVIPSPWSFCAWLLERRLY